MFGGGGECSEAVANLTSMDGDAFARFVGGSVDDDATGSTLTYDGGVDEGGTDAVLSLTATTSRFIASMRGVCDAVSMMGGGVADDGASSSTITSSATGADAVKLMTRDSNNITPTHAHTRSTQLNTTTTLNIHPARVRAAAHMIAWNDADSEIATNWRRRESTHAVHKCCCAPKRTTVHKIAPT